MYQPSRKRKYSEVIAAGDIDPSDFKVVLAEIGRRLQDTRVFPEGIIPLVGTIIETVLLDTEKGIERRAAQRQPIVANNEVNLDPSPPRPRGRGGRGRKADSDGAGSTGGGEDLPA